MLILSAVIVKGQEIKSQSILGRAERLLQGTTSFQNRPVNTNITFQDIPEVKEFCDDLDIDRRKFDSDYNRRDPERADIRERYRGNFQKV